MADAVTTTVLYQEGSIYVVHLTNISDGTGESAVIKVDRSTLTQSGAEPTGLTIMSARWAVQGFNSVRLLWDHTTDDVAMVLTGSGYEDFREFGGKPDPASTGGTGDLLLTTNGGSSGATYDITLVLRKK